MRKLAWLFAVIMFSSFQGWTQENTKVYLPLIGEEAPAFIGESTNGPINFPGDYTGKWKILYSHPADFTPVCTSELLELGALQNDFDQLGVKILILSTDALDTHTQWVKSINTLSYKNRDNVDIKFPLIADQNHEISRKYGMIHPSSNSSKDVRGAFIIDPLNKIRAIFFYPMNIGRNMDEIKRTVIALQTADSKDVLIPSNWEPGQDVLVKALKNPDNEQGTGVTLGPDVYQIAWYMTFKKMR